MTHSNVKENMMSNCVKINASPRVTKQWWHKRFATFVCFVINFVSFVTKFICSPICENFFCFPQMHTDLSFLQISFLEKYSKRNKNVNEETLIFIKPTKKSSQ